LITEKTPEGKYEVHPEACKMWSQDKGYHRNLCWRMAELEVTVFILPSRIAGPTQMGWQKR